MPNFEKKLCSIYAAEMYKMIFECVGEFYDNPTYSIGWGWPNLCRVRSGSTT